jgi:hypothetical protein
MTRAELVAWLRSQMLGQPRPYNWAKQNYNAGHDQALHKVIRHLKREDK